jgi:hypothetical protein
VPPPSTQPQQQQQYDPTIHPTASFDTTDSAARPTSFARQGSLSGSAINHGRGMYTMNNSKACLPYVSNTVIRSAVTFAARGPLLFYISHPLSNATLISMLYILHQDGVNPCQRLLNRSLLVI